MSASLRKRSSCLCTLTHLNLTIYICTHSQRQSQPTQNDLIPTYHGRTRNKKPLADHDSSDPNSTSDSALSSNQAILSLQTELSGPSATMSTAQEEGGQSLKHSAATKSESSSHPVLTPVGASGIKRRREAALVKDSLHKPFKSPVRPPGHGTPTAPKKQLRVSKPESVLQSSGASSSSPAALVAKDKQPLIHRPGLAASIAKRSNVRIPAQEKRQRFRSPFARDPESQPSGETALGRLMQLQALNARVTELQSSVRKAKQVIQLQQKRDDTPLVELIEKWKRASQEGAQTLLESYISQEQVLGPWGDDTGWSEPNEAPLRQPGVCVGGGTERSQSSHSLEGIDRERLDKQHEAEEARLEIQDVQQDLPTVEEAMRSRSWPDVGFQPAVTMTKMQKLLLSMGVNPAVIGYDQDQDAFTSEELPYDGS
ncbi:unnamed protein product [Mortierella alpina]